MLKTGLDIINLTFFVSYKCLIFKS